MKDEIQNIWKGESTELLKELHILTRDGKLNADSRRKLKQVHHLSQLIRPLIQKLAEKKGSIHVVDLGAGKSYLGFILYDLELRKLDVDYRLTAVESRPELIEKSKALAERSGFTKMDFKAANIDDAKLEQEVDLVTTLHACDTATDDAILFGLHNGATGFALVPCCQAEVARELERIEKARQSDETVHALYEFPIHRREFGSHLTNVIRTLFLRSKGYRVTVTELVGFEHSMKNELILAEKISDENHPESLRAQKELRALLLRFPVQMKLLSKT